MSAEAPRTESCFFPRPLWDQAVVNARGTPAFAETYAFRGSTIETLLFSILWTHHSPETILLFLHGEYSRQSHGLSMGPEGRANVERPFAIEHLKHVVSSGTEDGIWYKRFILFISFNISWIATTTQYENRYTDFTIHIPKSRRILSVEAFPSNGTSRQWNISN